MHSRALKLIAVAASAVAVSAQDTDGTINEVYTWSDEGTDLPVIGQPTSSFFGTRSDKEGADIISFSKSNNKLLIDRAKVEVSPFWKWSSSDPSVDCSVGGGSIQHVWDPCAEDIPTGVAIDPNTQQVAPSCVHSGLRRPEFSLSQYIKSGKVQPDENGDFALSEFQTVKPQFNVHSLDISLSPDGTTGTGVAVNYFPSEGTNSVNQYACEQVQVTVKVTQGSTGSDGTGFDGQSAVELVEVTDASSGDSLFILSILKKNDGSGEILKLSDGYKPWTPSSDLPQGATASETQALQNAWKYLKAPRPPVQTDKCDTPADSVASTTPNASKQSSALELQKAAYNWKAHMSIEYQGYKFYDEKVGFSVPPTHPGPFDWHPISHGRSAFEGTRWYELNCDSDSAVYNWLGHGAIYTYEDASAGTGYAFNDLWTHDMHYEKLGGDKIWFHDNFAGKKNGDAFTNRFTICPNTKMEMTCSSVHFNFYGNTKADSATREFFCVKDNELYTDAQMSHMQQQADALVNLYAKCPEKNPLKNWTPPKQYSKEVFVIVAGSVNNSDHVGKGGNISSGLALSEFQFDTNIAGLKQQQCAVSPFDRYQNGEAMDFPGVLGHQNQFPVTIKPSCDPTLSNRWEVHKGVKGEAQQHRDRAMNVGLEAMFTYDNNGVKTVYDRITYIGHSRGGAKANYLTHRHQTLYPTHNVRLVALGSMASINVDWGHQWFKNGLWVQTEKELGSKWNNTQKRNYINNGIACGIKGSEHDFAPYLLTRTETPFGTYTNEFNSMICEKVVIKKKGWFNDKKAWKTYFTTNRVAHPESNKALHFTYTPFAYYARGYDKLWY